MSNQIPGVPEGWELVGFRKPNQGDFVINWVGKIERWNNCESAYVFPLIRKIEKPARYRQFANAEEFKPHRDRWWRFKDTPEGLAFPHSPYNDKGPSGCTWQQAFNGRVFDDGTPFGVRINE
jgi:hypothetical protein